MQEYSLQCKVKTRVEAPLYVVYEILYVKEACFQTLSTSIVASPIGLTVYARLRLVVIQ